MKKERKAIYNAPKHHMVGDGFRVFNYFPNNLHGFKEVDPFLMLDYNEPHNFPPSEHKKGVGAHPHRGFETVTIVFEGALEHRDSGGGGGRIEAGDVQWMTAASGVLHDEFHPLEFSQKGGRMHAIQLWVNLPAKNKMDKPSYQNLTSDIIPNVPLDQKGSVARIISGDFHGTKGAARTFTPVEMYDITLKAGANVKFEVAERQNTMILVTQGKVSANENDLAFKDMLFFHQSGTEIEVMASEDSRIMALSGEPIGEPVASYGPFVMNTQNELVEAIEDFNSGKFGKLN